MVVLGSNRRWDRWHIISPIGSTFYIPLIVLAFWGVKNATYPTFYGNQKQTLMTWVNAKYCFECFSYELLWTWSTKSVVEWCVLARDQIRRWWWCWWWWCWWSCESWYSWWSYNLDTLVRILILDVFDDHYHETCDVLTLCGLGLIFRREFLPDSKTWWCQLQYN